MSTVEQSVNSRRCDVYGQLMCIPNECGRNMLQSESQTVKKRQLPVSAHLAAATSFALLPHSQHSMCLLSMEAA